MLRSGPPTFPCPQLTIQKVWQTLQSQPTLGPGEAGPGLPPGGMCASMDWPGHQVYGPSGRAWAVPAPGPKAASPRPPDTRAAVANPTIICFINLGLFLSASLVRSAFLIRRPIRPGKPAHQLLAQRTQRLIPVMVLHPEDKSS